MAFKRTAFRIMIMVIFYMVMLPALPSLYNTIVSLASPIGVITISFPEAHYNASTGAIEWRYSGVSYNLAYIFGVLLILIVLLAPILALVW